VHEIAFQSIQSDFASLSLFSGLQQPLLNQQNQLFDDLDHQKHVAMPTMVQHLQIDLNFMQIFDFDDQGWGSNKARRTDGVNLFFTHII
jgi:hypothetical protein